MPKGVYKLPNTAKQGPSLSRPQRSFLLLAKFFIPPRFYIHTFPGSL